LGQCIKIRDAQAAEAAASAAASRNPSPPPPVEDEPFNAFLLLSPRFGLTIEEVSETLKDDLARASTSFTFSTYFLPTDEIAIRATAHYSSFLHPSAIEKELSELKPRLAETLGLTQIAGSVILCRLDAGEEITRREVKGLKQQDGSGWSAVATRGAAAQKPLLEEPAAGKSTGRKLFGLKKKKVVTEGAAKEKVWAALGSDVEC
jgi:transcriptional repressor NF-X1